MQVCSVFETCASRPECSLIQATIVVLHDNKKDGDRLQSSSRVVRNQSVGEYKADKEKFLPERNAMRRGEIKPNYRQSGPAGRKLDQDSKLRIQTLEYFAALVRRSWSFVNARQHSPPLL